MKCECKGNEFVPRMPQASADVPRFVYWACMACARMVKSQTAKLAESHFRAWGVPGIGDEGARHRIELGIHLPSDVQRRPPINVRRKGEL